MSEDIGQKRLMQFKAYPITQTIRDMLSWDDPPWDLLPKGELTHFMGKAPDHFPKVAFKIAYTAEALFVMFRVADRYVLARAIQDQGEVWKDSCVEFFFTPGPDPRGASGFGIGSGIHRQCLRSLDKSA